MKIQDLCFYPLGVTDITKRTVNFTNLNKTLIIFNSKRFSPKRSTTTTSLVKLYCCIYAAMETTTSLGGFLRVKLMSYGNKLGDSPKAYKHNNKY